VVGDGVAAVKNIKGMNLKKHRTSNIEHPTSNGSAHRSLRCSMFDVRCSMFSLILMLAVPIRAAEPSPVKITLDTAAPGAAINENFAGLSFETQMLLPSKDGKYYFSPNNKPLIALFHQLGISSLRIGGNTADRPTVPIPGPTDIDQLFAFAKAADVKVIYTLRLREGSLDNAATIARYVWQKHRSLLECFAIGNEPNVFAKEYPVYREEWQKYLDAIVAASNAPGAKLCGPSATPGKTAWARDFAGDFGRSGRIAFISQHDYPGGAGNRATNVVAARDQMLSPAWLAGYRKFYNAFVPAAKTNGLGYRIEEANNFFNGGAKDVSDTFAAALWALDYLHWWAAHDALGINFHTGDQVAAGERMNPCRYASFLSSESGYHVQPIGYAIKAFTLGSRGRTLPVVIESKPELNLTAYAVLAADRSLWVTIINKEHGQAAHDADAALVVDKSYSNGTMFLLAGPDRDVAAKSGVTLGGVEIKDDASWEGKAQSLPLPTAGEFKFALPPATAAIIQLIHQ